MKTREGRTAASLFVLALLQSFNAASTLGQAILAPKPAVVIGGDSSFDGRGVTFGRIADIAVDAMGRLYVLDKYERRIGVFDQEGSALGSIGRPGEGPGEFADVAAMALDSRGRLFVVDNGNGRVAVFDVTGPQPKYRSSFRIESVMTDICSLGDRLFLLNHTQPQIISEVSDAGEIIAAFGAPVEPTGDLATAMGPGPHWRLSLGRLACANAPQVVLFVSEMLPIVRAYTPSGTLLWSETLPDFHTVNLARSKRLNACCTYGPNTSTGTVSSVVGVAVDQDQAVLISVIETRPPELDGPYAVHLVDIRNGALKGTNRGAGAVLGFVSGRPVAMKNDPVPVVMVY